VPKTPRPPTPPPVATAPAPRPVSQTINDAEFLRRLCLDLTGSLPTRLETTYFVADPTSSKREKIVEWLLADDTVKDYLAKRLGVTPDRIRLLKVIDTADGRTVKLGLVVSGPVTASWNVTALAFSPDGKALATEVTPRVTNLATFSANAPKGVAIADLDKDGRIDLFVANGTARTGQVLIDGGVNSTTGIVGALVVNERYFSLLNEPPQPTQPAEIVYWLQPPAANTGVFNLIRRQAILADPPAGQAPAALAGNGNVRVWNLAGGTVKTQGQPGQPLTWGTAPLAEYLSILPDGLVAGGGQYLAFSDAATLTDSDEAFLQRVIEQARGGAPTALEQKYFAEDKDPKKREKLLDLLLKDPGVAKKVGDEWKKKMLEPIGQKMVVGARVTIDGNTPGYRVVTLGDIVRIEGTLIDPLTARAGKLIDELIAAKKTDEQLLEAITLATVGRLPTDGEKRLTLAAASKAGDRKAAWVEVAKALAGSDEAKAHAATTAPPATPAPPVPPAKP